MLKNNKNPNEIVVYTEKRKHTWKIFAIIFIIIIAIIYFYNNFFYKLFPQYLLKASIVSTCIEVSNEKNDIYKNISKKYKDVNFKEINSYSLEKESFNADITIFDTYFYGNLSVSNKFKTNYFGDTENFMFNVGESNYLSFDINEYLYEANNDTVDKMGFSIYKNVSNELFPLIIKENVVTFNDDNTTIEVLYTKDEFKQLSDYILSKADKEVIQKYADIYISTFLYEKDEVYVTYYLKNSGKQKNNIYSISIDTDKNQDDRHIRLTFNDDKFLLKDASLSLKLYKTAHTYGYESNLFTDANELTLNLFGKTYNFFISSIDNKLIINANDSLNLSLSTSYEEMNKPTNIITIPFLDTINTTFENISDVIENMFP